MMMMHTVAGCDGKRKKGDGAPAAAHCVDSYVFLGKKQKAKHGDKCWCNYPIAHLSSSSSPDCGDTF
jgi:hypothetical protein